MRFVTLCLLAATFACKKSPEPTLPRPPDSTVYRGGGVEDLTSSTLFHTIYRYPGHASQAIRFYEPEMEKRGAHPLSGGQTYMDDNMTSNGGNFRETVVTPRDPAKPGVYVAVLEISDATYIEVYENVPKGP
jgi:hypothetical protein